MTESSDPAARRARRRPDKAYSRLSRRYQDALRVADFAAAERVARQALDEGASVAGLYQRVIAPAMWRIGELWEEGAISVADEHLATALTHQVMASIYGPNLGHKTVPGRVLLAAVEGEHHALGLRMAADLIELAGYETTYLGADVPTDALLEAVRTRSPDLVALAATMPDSTTALDFAVAEVRRLDPGLTILYGGRGARPLLDRPGAVLVEDLEHLLPAVRAALEALPAGRARTPPPAEPEEEVAPAGAAAEPEPLSVERNLSGIAAETANLARELARQANTYRDLAYTDKLSGLPNRRAFEDRAGELGGRADAQPVAVLMVDLDGFKAVNDSQGHEAGDRVLALMAATIAAGLRDGDFVARLGGDEFAALLPRTGPAEAERLAERLRVGVEKAGAADSVTASVGVAMLEDDLRRALLEADVALYEAKAAGRNVVRSV